MEPVAAKSSAPEAVKVQFNDDGLVAAIVQDATTGSVLMMAWMSEESLKRSLQVGETVFWSRSRQEIWHKGATSGNTQRIVSAAVDCDGDTLLFRVEPAGPACHTGADNCFFTPIHADRSESAS